MTRPLPPHPEHDQHLLTPERAEYAVEKKGFGARMWLSCREGWNVVGGVGLERGP